MRKTLLTKALGLASAGLLATTLLVSVLLLLAALSRIVDLRNLFGAR